MIEAKKDAGQLIRKHRHKVPMFGNTSVVRWNFSCIFFCFNHCLVSFPHASSYVSIFLCLWCYLLRPMTQSPFTSYHATIFISIVLCLCSHLHCTMPMSSPSFFYDSITGAIFLRFCRCLHHPASPPSLSLLHIIHCPHCPASVPPLSSARANATSL